MMKHLRKLADLITEFVPDLVCLQEPQWFTVGVVVVVVVVPGGGGATAAAVVTVRE